MQYCLKDRLSNIRRASNEKPSESAECHESQSGKQVSIKTCFQDIQGCNNLRCSSFLIYNKYFDFFSSNEVANNEIGLNDELFRLFSLSTGVNSQDCKLEEKLVLGTCAIIMLCYLKENCYFGKKRPTTIVG